MSFINEKMILTYIVKNVGHKLHAHTQQLEKSNYIKYFQHSFFR